MTTGGAGNPARITSQDDLDRLIAASDPSAALGIELSGTAVSLNGDRHPGPVLVCGSGHLRVSGGADVHVGDMVRVTASAGARVSARGRAVVAAGSGALVTVSDAVLVQAVGDAQVRAFTGQAQVVLRDRATAQIGAGVIASAHDRASVHAMDSATAILCGTATASAEDSAVVLIESPRATVFARGSAVAVWDGPVDGKRPTVTLRDSATLRAGGRTYRADPAAAPGSRVAWAD